MPQTSPTNRATTRRASEAARLAAQRPDTASPPTSPSPTSSPSQTSSSALTEEHAESSAPKPVKEKRKRSRVTPDQLVALEGIFAVDRSPTATRRKEISEELGMDERQTQVWFQNRRAKAKLLEQGKIMSKGRAVPLASRGSSVSGDWEEGLTQYIHEEEPVKFVRCTELSIGSWTRRASATSPSDLIVYINDTRQRLSFFVNSEHSTCSVKMDIPFSTIKDISLMPALPNAPSIAKVVLLLRQPPAFFMATAVADTSERREWTHCHDWTEGFMATSTLRHTIIGQLEALNEMYSHLNARLPSFPVYDTPPSFQYASSSPSLSPSSNYVTTGPTTSYTQPVEVYGILPSSSPPIGVNSPAYSTTSSMYPYPTSPPTNPSPFFAGSLDAGSGTGFSSYPAQASTPVSLSTMPFEPVTLPRRTSVADYAYMGHPTYEQSWFQG